MFRNAWIQSWEVNLHFRLNEPNDPISSNHNQVCQSRVSSSDYYLKSSMSAWYWNSRDRSWVMASCHSGQCQVHRQIFSKVKRRRHRHLLNLQSQDLYHHALCVNRNATHVYIKIHLYACTPTSSAQTSMNIVALRLSQLASQKYRTMIAMIQAQEKDPRERQFCRMLYG